MNKFFKNATETRKNTKLERLFCASVAATMILLIQSCSSAPEVEIPEEIVSLENLTVIELSNQSFKELIPERILSFGDTEDVIIGRMGASAIDLIIGYTLQIQEET